ncbi:oxidoreductase [Lithospermum erythrorhizon]|uniref:Oxidoreductase n=1 Tax=Lithospermum erythrorhizon TaxID=34254 RepID=A0AAV3RFK2_LITER
MIDPVSDRPRQFHCVLLPRQVGVLTCSQTHSSVQDRQLPRAPEPRPPQRLVQADPLDQEKDPFNYRFCLESRPVGTRRNSLYGPAEDIYGRFINRVRKERPPEYLENVRGLTKWVPPPVKMTGSFVRDRIDVSRKRMDVAALDMLQFHWWDYSNPGYLDALKQLTDLKEGGKIKTIALTNFDTQRLQIILENGIPVVSNQVQHSIIDMRPQQKMAELCQLTGVKLITYGTVMGGLLTEKFLDANLMIPFGGPPINTPSLKKYKKMIDAWGGWSLFQALLRTLKTVASKHGVSIATVAVRYILDQPSVAGSMIGVRLGLSEHINDANAVLSLVIDEEDINTIQEASKKGRDLMKVIGDCGDEYRNA